MTERTTRRVVRPRWIHVAVIGALVVAAIATITKIPQVFQAAEPAPVSASTRALAPAAFYRVDPRLLVSAARAIPRDATYAVFGRDPARTLLEYWLLPRRRTDVRSSAWIVSIGGDLRSLRVRYGRVLRVGHGSELAEVRR
jgi:hypothetical protein